MLKGNYRMPCGNLIGSRFYFIYLVVVFLPHEIKRMIGKINTDCSETIDGLNVCDTVHEAKSCRQLLMCILISC